MTRKEYWLSQQLAYLTSIHKLVEKAFFIEDMRQGTYKRQIADIEAQCQKVLDALYIESQVFLNPSKKDSLHG